MPAPKGNKYAVGNNGGRPPKYETPAELEEKVIQYFDWIEGEFEMVTVTVEHEYGPADTYEEKKWIRQPERPTVTGLALFLGFADKSSMYEYKKKEEFSYPVKRALTVIENNYENALDSKSPTGAIFALKNMDWSDKTNIDHTTGGESFNIRDLIGFKNA